MNSRKTCGPSRSADLRRDDSPWLVTLRHSHISLEITSRTLRAPRRAASTAPAIALGLSRS